MMRQICFTSTTLILLAGSCLAQPAYNIKLTVSGQAACTNSPALTQGTSATVSVSKNSGSSANSAPKLKDISLTKVVDGCSIALYKALFSGAHLQTVTIVVSSGATDLLKLTLTGALVTEVSDTEALYAAPTEKIAFDFERIEILDVVTNTSVGFDKNSNHVLP